LAREPAAAELRRFSCADLRGLPSMIRTPVTEMLGVEHPVILAGMGGAAGPDLVAAVTNAGGLGVMGGINYTPKMLRAGLKDITENIKPGLFFGVDLALPKVGGGARKTNYDYTHGHLPELLDIIIEFKAKLFVCAIGVCPRFAVDKLHAAGILVMNMVGSPKHVTACLDVGCDLICAQGGEGGGHTGEIATSILIPKVVDVCRGHKSPLTGLPIGVVAGGGIHDGRGLAMALALGAGAVWVGTRFVASEECDSSPLHKKGIVNATYTDTVRSEVLSGRPLRLLQTEYFKNWHTNRRAEMQDLLDKGVVPYAHDIAEAKKRGEEMKGNHPYLAGQVSGSIDEVLPAKTIVELIVTGAAEVLKANAAMLTARL